MNTNRRKFISSAVGAGLASLPLSSYGSRTAAPRSAPAGPASSALQSRYSRLDEILKQPVLKKQLFAAPVIIESLELLRLDNSFLCRVRSRDGAEGLSVGHSGLRTLFPIFLDNLQPFFIGKDARELDLILEKVYIYGFNFRYNGITLGLPLATIEFAILDMLGRIANKPVGQLIGEIHNPEVGVYAATEWREKQVEESIELIKGAVAEYDVHALKIKIGGLMFMTTDMYAVGPPGRTERMIPLVRKTFGDGMALYADSNSFYSVDEAIRVGRLLEEYKYRYFEEPVMFDHIEEIKQVADTLTIPIANGEQDYSFYGFRWLIANDGIDIVQPDNYYFGGLIRSMKVARMANAFGKSIVPHMSGGGLGYLYDIHFVSAVPNAGAHHEFKGLKTNVQFECKTSPLKVVNGKIKVPTGPGFGVDLDPEWVKKHQALRM
jgi:L-alanine-DL-glutamate epimerase-like enolase superfamily enzyme